MLKKLDQWHKTKPGYLIFAMIELAIAYGFTGLAIDRGSFLWYALALIFLVGALQNTFRLIGAIVHSEKRH